MMKIQPFKLERYFTKYEFSAPYLLSCSDCEALSQKEILAIMALRAKDKILKRNLGIIESNLKILDEFFAKHTKLFDWHRPKAGPIGFPILKANVDIADFCLELVEKKGVMLLPSKVYDFKGNHFRIGFARKNMPEALAKLEEYLKENY